MSLARRACETISQMRCCLETKGKAFVCKMLCDGCFLVKDDNGNATVDALLNDLCEEMHKEEDKSMKLEELDDMFQANKEEEEVGREAMYNSTDLYSVFQELKKLM